jgi:hypothetical protein
MLPAHAVEEGHLQRKKTGEECYQERDPAGKPGEEGVGYAEG